jgi:hypothetical protein
MRPQDSQRSPPQYYLGQEDYLRPPMNQSLSQKKSSPININELTFNNFNLFEVTSFKYLVMKNNCVVHR